MRQAQGRSPADVGWRRAAKVPSWTAPELSFCGSSGCAWRLWAARLGTSVVEAGPLGAQPLPWMLKLAASKVADSAAFHPGLVQVEGAADGAQSRVEDRDAARDRRADGAWPQYAVRPGSMLHLTNCQQVSRKSRDTNTDGLLGIRKYAAKQLT